ncbi:uncharacterized protein LOC121055511, partial [Oryza brachyantha]|uniref:uncharacterized protein LOC121055511 n=1 Tax=Oryza brachyantha TaxID=4533 RepID=UPI001ADB8B9E
TGWHHLASKPSCCDLFTEPGRLLVSPRGFRPCGTHFPAFKRRPKCEETRSSFEPWPFLRHCTLCIVRTIDRTAAAMDASEAMRRNAELEKAAAEAAAREERLRRELEAALARLAVAEEAEERLCVQLGELEAEAVAEAVEYQQQVRELSERLALMDAVLRSSGHRRSALAAGTD